MSALDGAEIRDGVIAAPDDNGSRAFRQLREKARKADALEREVRQLRTDAAFRDSGLALTVQQRAALLAVHEGEITAEAIKETAVSLSFVDQQQVSLEEQAALKRIADATAAAEPSEAFLKTLEDEMREAKSPEHLQAILAREGMLAED